MHLTALLTVSAFLFIAWEASRRDRKPLVALTGLGLFGAAVVGHLFSGTSLLHSAVTLAAEVGVGLLLGAGLLALRKATAKPFLAIGLLCLGLSGLLHGAERLLGGAAASDTSSFLVELGPDDDISEIAPILRQYGVRYERAFPEISRTTDADLAQTYLVFGDPSVFDRLMERLRSDRENVDHVERNRLVHLEPVFPAETPQTIAEEVLENDPLVAQQWALDAIHAHEAHAMLRDMRPARKAVVAIVDTGVDARHEDVGGVFRSSPATTDRHGHGTHCAGIAGAVTNNGLGIASLNWEGRFLEVTGYRALNASGMGTLEMIAQAVIDAARDGADVISMSLGDRSPVPPKVIVEAITFAQEQGAVVVASAGNSNEDARYHMPSNVEGVITVAAVDERLEKARFSNTNTSLARPIAAPGVNILSLKPNDGYVSLSGTSMSTPMVAGLIGVMRALNPDLTAEDLYRILHETGVTVSASARVGRMIDAEAALRAALSGS